ncbi:MAG: sigma-70 family RNA polymerase sigma factor [Candidatus Eisenbacteria bacterium]|uniref:Sigma-70 family RNA polymerase sigma factor n=1 Tax=Eiseniibacteriota bacterium TaxID=2212470 RepID=A0A948W771_UNCEI|nr:sigma-70 family RNA polymerase sigma factor [Candidatus Eisenbacteria bacterium]MBU1947917.1 sigma-70 family RNA polymerase sigma factor [Candidatus Eisenbacteria bacterium]MBU2691915.1 sigma-70 family RNA polymerase sigma factor [Candidatus Eisenbacteria bacterium]
MNEITRILTALEQGDPRAADELLPLVYQELRRLAAQKLARETPGQTLQATALVHEAYLRIVGSGDQDWSHRGHFFAAAAEAMRRILIEAARRKKSLKRGGDRRRVELDDATLAIEGPSDDILALNQVLDRFTEVDPEAAELVKLRYFGGLTLEQIAQIRGVTRRTVVNHWAYARAWLHREMTKE